ncbi:amidase signature domain-containing protein [Aspergillus oleicola]
MADHPINKVPLKERHESDASVEAKAEEFVKLLKTSERFIVFTGAGVSTSAGIPDFRGPNGNWTLRAQGKTPKRDVNTLQAIPTLTHMALVELQNRGILTYLVSQNCDGLHRRSGIRPEMISELHGNSNREYCKDCGKEYLRDFRAVSTYEKGDHDHRTGRTCTICGGILVDTIINFGEGLPQDVYHKAEKQTNKADLCLVLGSSLIVGPAWQVPYIVASRQGYKKDAKFVICNLQETQHDEYCAIRVFAKTDEFMSMVMEKLELPIPEFVLRRNLVLTIESQDEDRHRVTATGVDSDGTPFRFLQSLRLEGTRRVAREEPFTINIRETLEPGEAQLKLELEFMGHYNEPNLELFHDYVGDEEARTPHIAMAEFSLVEASIEDLSTALLSGHITSVELVARYLHRISTYDCRNVTLNAIPILNISVFDEAAASDDRRATGKVTGPLDGIPYTIKDSFKVKGMTVAAGSPAFKDLMANDDSFVAGTLRQAGAVLIGRTNMPSMACGGMQRGIWGRAENPYNPEYLAAAFASGSSNGSAVSTAASFAAFGVGAETVSSGRSPASNNALVAYTPSRGWLSCRGNWPLYPTCDVPVPHARTMRDLLHLLDVLAVPDPVKKGEFWREQEFVALPEPWYGAKPEFLTVVSKKRSLAGLRIAIPRMFIGGPIPEGARKVETSSAVIELWNEARKDLESLGAEIVLVNDFPAMTAYENPDLLPKDCRRLPEGWNSVERGTLIAHAWNDFLKRNRDPDLPDLHAVDTSKIYPEWLRTDAELQFFEKPNAIQYHGLKDALASPSIPGLKDAVLALEGMRKCLLEDWLTEFGCDCVAFPAAGDVGPSNADKGFEDARLAWRNGAYYSNGNRAIRHLGIPTVSVPMGIMADKGVPMNLTFAGRAYDDLRLLTWANAFEARTTHRVPPMHTPPLSSDFVSFSGSPNISARPLLEVVDSSAISDCGWQRITIQGRITVLEPRPEGLPVLKVMMDAATTRSDNVVISRLSGVQDGDAVFSFRADLRKRIPVPRPASQQTWAPVARDKTMVVVLARTVAGGRPSGWLGLF